MIRSTEHSFAIVCPCARCVDAMTSSRSSRAHTRRHRFLPDRDVEELREPAGAEALLDLLFEAADEEHLAEEPAQHLLGHSPASSPAFSSTVAIERPLCDPPMRAADQWARMEVELGPDWDDAHLSFTPEGSTAADAAILAPLAQDGSDGSSDSTSPATGAVASGFGIFSRGSTPCCVWGTLSLIESTQPMPAADGPTPRRSSLVNAWDAVARLAPAGATSCASSSSTRATICRERPPRRADEPDSKSEAIALRFRVSGKQGYGVAAGDARRCPSGWTQTGSRGGSRSWASSPTRRTPIRRAPSGGWPDAPSKELSLSERSSRIPSCPRGHADRRGSAGSRSF